MRDFEANEQFANIVLYALANLFSRACRMEILKLVFVCFKTEKVSKYIQAVASWVALVINPPAKAGDVGNVGFDPGSGRSLKEESGTSLQYTCRDSLMDRGPGGLQPTQP